MTKKREKRWRPKYDELITNLLVMSHGQAALKVGFSEAYVSHLMRWPRFKREYRRRRANIVEHADAKLQGVADMIVSVLIRMMQYETPQVVEYTSKDGKKKRVTNPADPRLAMQAAMAVYQIIKGRTESDEIYTRFSELEAQLKAKIKNGAIGNGASQ